MRVAGIEFRWVRLPLVTPFRTSRYTEYDREVLLIRVRTAEGVSGWGECVAMRGGIYSDESMESAEKVLRDVFIPMLLELPVMTAENAKAEFARVEGHPMAKAALEMALLDAQLRLEGVSLALYLGAEHTEVRAGVSVGIMPLEELRDTVRRYHFEERYQRIKLKIEPGWDIEPVEMIRGLLGDEADIQVDGNGAYTLDDLTHLKELDRFGLVLLEQPLDANDLEGHAELARHLSTPICLDEPITCAADATKAIDLGAASIINIKPGRVGGYLEARDIHHACADRKVPVWVGGMLETGLGRAANVALAALPHFSLVGDLSASERFFKRDITPPIVMRNGLIRVPTGPGIGIEPDEESLAEATQDVLQIPIPSRIPAGRAN
jgi:O-succinylbenzoate synthase